MLPRSALMAALLIVCQAVWWAAFDVTLTFPEDRNCGTVSCSAADGISGVDQFF